MKYRRLKLQRTTFTKNELNHIKEYCDSLGYELDVNPKEFEGIYFVIKDPKTNRKGYLQKIKGSIYWVYNNKRENISFYLDMYDSMKKFNIKIRNSTIVKFICGITDFEYSNNYFKQ